MAKGVLIARPKKTKLPDTEILDSGIVNATGAQNQQPSSDAPSWDNQPRS